MQLLERVRELTQCIGPLHLVEHSQIIQENSCEASFRKMRVLLVSFGPLGPRILKCSFVHGNQEKASGQCRQWVILFSRQIWNSLRIYWCQWIPECGISA